MTDDQLSAFEDQAKRVGRKSLPPAWRAEILEAALRSDEGREPIPEPSPSPFKAVVRTDARAKGAVREPAQDETIWEARIRKAERRVMFSIAACFIVSLFVIALLLQPGSELRLMQLRDGEDSAREVIVNQTLDKAPLNAPREESRFRSDLRATAKRPPVIAARRSRSSTRERGEETLNKRSRGLESGDNSLAAIPPPPPDGESVPAAPDNAPDQIEDANGGLLINEANVNDVFQMLAKRAGKQYFQNNRIAGPEFKVSGRLNKADPMEQMEELAFMYGLSLHEKGGTVYALDQEQLNNLPTKELRYPLRSLRPDDSEQIKELVEPMLSPGGVARYEPETNSVIIKDSSHKVDQAWDFLTRVDKPQRQAETGSAGIMTDLGQHSDHSSWDNVTVAGGVFAAKKDASTIGGVAHNSADGGLPGREEFGSGNGAFIPFSPANDDSLVLSSAQLEGAAKARKHDGLTQLHANPAAITEEGEEATISLVDRVPVITTTTNETEVANQVTEEVRYSVDQKDPVGDPATTREIGVTVAVTPALLSDGTIRMKMRPRSAQIVEEIIAPSGTKYTQVSESMLESVARVPEGHSVVVGGFYGEVKQKDQSKVPLLGNHPTIDFFLKGEDTAQEPASLLFVATPTRVGDQVVIETKILSVNSSAAERTGMDWTTGLAEGGVPRESLEKLNSLIGINQTGQVEDDAPASSDGTIVLSPVQTESVLRTLTDAGLVTQTSNPRLITQLKESEAIKRERRALDDLEMNAGDEPYSTFSLNVSDVSFKLSRAALAIGKWPPVDQVRVEEFVNAFDYGDPAPSQEEKVDCHLEQAAHPFLQQRNLLRVSMRTAALGRAADTPLRLTVLLDNSGSMDRSDRVESVKKAFQLLATQLNPQDQVTLIGFARTPRLLADRLAGNRVAELAQVVEATPSEGGTNIEEALELGIAKAKEQMLEGGQNRIILLTDGAANLGNAEPEDLAKLVESMRQQGIAFDACGVGAAGLNDTILESLTRKGDGRYYFLDRPEDADDGFAKQIAGALRPAARNVKVQLHFNPERVGRYRLYGFDKHRLKKEDFRDDSVDAAELAAEEVGNAIYHVELRPQGRGEIGTVSVRFQDTESGRMIERKWTIPYEPQVPRLEDAAASLRLASGAALLAEKLKGSQHGEAVQMGRLARLINNLPNEFPSADRVKQLVQMANQTRELLGE